MSTVSGLLVAVVAAGCLGLTTAAVGGTDRDAESPRRQCQEACREQHRTWVQLCLDNHDPRAITPAARGQCVEAGADRLRACRDQCRDVEE